MSIDRVLVVDDDDFLVDLMATALKRRGYQVDQARDGLHAVKIMTAKRGFSVLLTDMMMPGMSGLELMREAKKIDEHIEVVIVTAAQEVDTAITAMRANGAYDYLLKPFDSMNQMLLAVERAAVHRRLLMERNALLGRMQRDAEVLRALVGNTGDAVFTANARSELQIVNPPAARLVGSDHLEGTNAFEVLPEQLAILITNWQAVGGGIPTAIEFPWKDSSVLMVNLIPLTETDEEKTGWVMILRDITYLKRLETLKTQLLVETAGRIRAPLALAMNALVDLSVLTNQNERVSEVVYRLTQIWKRILEWGEDLNALMQVEADCKIRQMPIDLNEMLTELCQCRTGLTNSISPEINMEVAVDPALPDVNGDPDLLRRLLHGLVNRAASRNDQGSPIRLNARSHNGQVWISISDEGPAVSNAELPHLFEKSFVKSGVGSSSGTTGLEMALVKQITDRLGGQVWVGGQGKPGSTIFVSLPMAAAR